MKIIYKKVAERATNLRFQQDDYSLQENELDHGMTEDGLLPNINTLHDLAHYKVLKKQEVKTEARSRIVTLIPEWKQANLLARATELLRKEVAATITAPETTELNAIENTWLTVVQPIRASSDTIEAEIDGLVDFDAVDTYDVVDNINW